MLERLLLTVMILGGLILVYCVFTRWQLKRAQIQANSDDPLLSAIPTGQSGILYFTAEWCGACKLQQRPALQQLLINQPGLQVITIDVDANPHDAQRWGVMSLPTTIILNTGHTPIAVNHGAVSAQKLAQQLKR